ncbi:hypothetical protein TrVE_jg13890 [Triparma verrucosa]|uniref:B box-type domain-containing protein n=2 Tax=Triparma TaxID=722752 RepID=A0A9W7BVF0_9STRA|nr:hypothetical protein TrVE_jg13890 [Triparma verrucosa]GMH97116.1 hypothetical protein TrST_g5380 [Triparma strigata]
MSVPLPSWASKQVVDGSEGGNNDGGDILDVSIDRKDYSETAAFQNYDDAAAIRLRRSLHPPNLPSIRRSMIRTVFILLDLSQCMSAPSTHLAPNMFATVKLTLINWLRDFLNLNPCSSIAIIYSNNSGSTLLSDLTSSLPLLLNKLSTLKQSQCEGSCNLRAMLSTVSGIIPCLNGYSLPEIVLFYGGIHIQQGLGKVQDNIVNTSLNIFSLESEIYALRNLTTMTNPSNYFVPMSRTHLSSQLKNLLLPPTCSTLKPQMVEYGFPTLKNSPCPQLTHSDTGAPTFTNSFFSCPKCSTLTSSIPSTCKTCSLVLINVTDLSKGYRSIHPINQFKEIKPSTPCTACGELEEVMVTCEKCGSDFCWMCDEVMHDYLHNCPGCLLEK